VLWTHFESNVETGEVIDRKFNKLRGSGMSVRDLHKNKTSQGLRELCKNPVFIIKRLPEI
jgi:hypothetical protein